MEMLPGTLWTPSANKPWSLHDQEACWQVVEGSIHIYVVSVLPNGEWGRRRHLFEVLEGGFALGIPRAQGNSHPTLLVGQVTPGTHGLYLDKQRMRVVRASTDTVQIWQRIVSVWIQKLGESLVSPPRPRLDHNLDPGVEQAYEAGLNLYTAPHQVLWAKLIDGHLLWVDNLSLAQDHYYPITSTLWLKTTEKCRISLSLTQDLSTRELMDALFSFNELVIQILTNQAINAREKESDRLSKREHEGQLVFSTALSRLSHILSSQLKQETISTPLSSDYFFPVFSSVLAASGLEAKELASLNLIDSSTLHYLQKLARASKVNYRSVTLGGGLWWKEDPIPMISFWKETGQPIALLPDKARWGVTIYSVYDPLTGLTSPLDKKTIDKLGDTGYMFFGTFSPETVTFKDILKLGLNDVHKEVIYIIALGILIGLIGIVTPAITGDLVKTVLPAAETSALIQSSIILLIIAISTAGLGLSSAIAVMRLEGKMGMFVNAAVIDRLLALPTQFFTSYSAGDLSSRLFGVDGILQLLSGTTIYAFMSGIFSIFSFGYLFFIDIKLALIALLITLIAVMVTVGINLRRLQYARDTVQRDGELSGEVFQLLTGLTKLRVAAIENRAFARWADGFSAQNKSSFHSRTLRNGITAFNSVLPILSGMALFAMVAFGSIKMDAGTFISFNAAFGQFLAAGISLGAAMTSILHVIPLFDRMRPILEAQPEVDPIKPDAPDITGAIELSSVTFRYSIGSPPVLNQISLSINHGEFLAIVGPSGSGKSTLLRLLLGFDAPESGAVYYDKIDLAGLDLRSLRRQIGVVLQAGRLVPGSLLTNIVGSSSFTYENALEAAHMAGMEEDLKGMPMGLHTVVSEGASTFSAGQRQRVLIARALVKKPRVLIFDEATSALDNRTQAMVSESIEKLNATRIVIAHRLSTIRQADRIVVLDQGVICEAGTYDELIALNGRFSHLAKRQLA